MEKWTATNWPTSKLFTLMWISTFGNTSYDINTKKTKFLQHRTYNQNKQPVKELDRTEVTPGRSLCHLLSVSILITVIITHYFRVTEFTLIFRI